MKSFYKCFHCEKNENEVILIETPLNLVYKDINLSSEFLRVNDEKAYLCLECVSEEFDGLE
jgi:hypothetical protein